MGKKPGRSPGGLSRPNIASDPVIEAYTRDIDRTLLRENLKLTAEERFRKRQALQRFATELRRAGIRARQ